jgi:hypothetical protein
LTVNKDTPPPPCLHLLLLQEQREQLEQQYEATAADLEREQQLNASMRLAGSLLDAVKISKDYAVNVLEAAADKPTRGGQQQPPPPQQQLLQQRNQQLQHQVQRW